MEIMEHVSHHSDQDPDDHDFEVPYRDVDDEGDSDSESEGDDDSESDDSDNDDNDDANEGDDKQENEEDEDGDDDGEFKPEEDRTKRYEFEVEEVVGNWVDECMIRGDTIPDTSDEDEDPVITRDRNIRLGTDAKLAIGRTFFTGFEFKETVLHYALRNRANLKQTRWEKEKLEFKCAGKTNCCWKVYCSYDARRLLWIVKTVCLDHTCTPNGKCKLLKKSGIAKLFMDKLRMQHNYMPLDIQRHIKEQWKISSTIGQCQTGRFTALKWLKDEYAHQFAHLRGYVAEIISSNPGSTAIVDTITNGDGNHVFNRIYVCLEAMKNVFYYCRPLIGIDGTFLKQSVKGCLFTAIAHNANNQIYPVAWATVQSENADNWLWFLNQLKEDLNLKDETAYVVISDRCKGLISAVKTVLPNAEHIPCVKHIVENLKKRHGQ